MKRLLHQPPAQSQQESTKAFRSAPLVDEGKMTRQEPHRMKETAVEMKREEVPAKKRVTAREYAAVLSAVMMLAALTSQATVIVGCAKSLVGNKKDIPVVTVQAPASQNAQGQKATTQIDAGKQTKAEQQQNVSAPAIIQKQAPSEDQQNVSAPAIIQQRWKDNLNQTIVVPSAP